jgi:hypothetical protein
VDCPGIGLNKQGLSVCLFLESQTTQHLFIAVSKEFGSGVDIERNNFGLCKI